MGLRLQTARFCVIRYTPEKNSLPPSVHLSNLCDAFSSYPSGMRLKLDAETGWLERENESFKGSQNQFWKYSKNAIFNFRPQLTKTGWSKVSGFCLKFSSWK